MRNSLCALVLAACLAAAGSPSVHAQSSEEETPSELAREGMERLLRALEVFIEMIPQYEMPEVTEDGDIIIRRKRRPDEAPAAEPEIDETRT